jgi:lipoprotein LprG
MGVGRWRPGSLAAGLLGVLVLLLSGCSREPLPDPGPLLERSSRAMGKISTVRFTMDIDGTVAPLQLQTVRGVLTSRGDAKGTLTLLSDNLVEWEFVLLGNDLYLKQSTGGFLKLPPKISEGVYDPDVLLRPEHGLPAVLTGATEARTRGVERVAGVRTHRITARVTTELIEGLTFLEPGQERLPATLWLSIDDGRLIRAQIDFRTRYVSDDTRLTLTLSKFDEPVDVEPPPV